MIITQKFNSVSEIDLEFIPTLENLLSDCMPSFEWIKDYEKNAPENIYFNYYLFFGDKHNAPIGFAQVELSQENEPKGFFSKFLKNTKEKLKIAHWSVPGCYQEAVVFEPMYKSLGVDKASHLIEEFSARKDIQTQTLRFGQAYSTLPTKLHSKITRTNERVIADTLVKNQSHYQAYLQSLNPLIQKEVKALWKNLHLNSFQIVENDDFKEMFAYKKDGSTLYKELKNNSQIKRYLKLNSNYISLEKDNEILAIVFMIQGINQNYFYDFLILAPAIDEKIIHQLAIMNFYDKEDSHRLHLLFHPTNHESFLHIGFTNRKQVEFSLRNE